MMPFQYLAPRESQRSITPSGSVRSSQSSTSSPPQSIPAEKRKHAAALLHRYEKTPKESPTNSPVQEEIAHHSRRHASLSQKNCSQHLSPTRPRRQSDAQALPNMMSTLKFSNKSAIPTHSTGGRKKPLGKKTKAKAALIRYLGACSTCRRRKVTCSINHHDISSLKDIEGVEVPDDVGTVYTEDTSPTLSPFQTGGHDYSWGAHMDHGISHSAHTDPILYSPMVDNNENDFIFRPPPPEIRVEQEISHTGFGAMNHSFNDPTLFSGLQDDSSVPPDYHQTLLETDLLDDENFSGSSQGTQAQHMQDFGYQDTAFAYSPMLPQPLGSHLSIPDQDLPAGEYFSMERIPNMIHIGTRDESGERPKYTCSSDGCVDSFGDLIRLHDHYSRYHMSFQRLPEPERLVCCRCDKFLGCREDTCPYCNHNFLLVRVYGSDTSSFSNEPIPTLLHMNDGQQHQHPDNFWPQNNFYNDMNMSSFNNMSFNDPNINVYQQRHHSRHTRKFHNHHHSQSSTHRRTRRCVLHNHNLTTDLLQLPCVRAAIVVLLTVWALSLAYGVRIGLALHETYVSVHALDISYYVLTMTLVLLCIALWQVSTLLLDRRRRNDHGHHCHFRTEITI